MLGLGGEEEGRVVVVVVSKDLLTRHARPKSCFHRRMTDGFWTVIPRVSAPADTKSRFFSLSLFEQKKNDNEAKAEIILITTAQHHLATSKVIHNCASGSAFPYNHA